MYVSVDEYYNSIRCNFISPIDSAFLINRYSVVSALLLKAKSGCM